MNYILLPSLVLLLVLNLAVVIVRVATGAWRNGNWLNIAACLLLVAAILERLSR